MKPFSLYLKEARESLERRWNDITRAMGQIPSTTNPMGPFNQYDVDVNLGGDFPVKVKPFSLSPVAGVAGDFTYNPAKGRSGEIRLDPVASVQRSPVLWHELAHGTQASAFDRAVFPEKISFTQKSPKPDEAISASVQKAVPYHAKSREIDARGFEYGKVSSNAGRQAAEKMLATFRALAQQGGVLPPSTEPIQQMASYRDKVQQAHAKNEQKLVRAALAEPVTTPLETVFGGTRAPSESEIKIRKATIRKEDQLVRRGMQNAADMTRLGFDQTASPAIVKSIMRQIKKTTGAEQASPREWEAKNRLLQAILGRSKIGVEAAANKTPVSRGEYAAPPPLPNIPTPKATDINTRSLSVSPRFKSGMQGLGVAAVGSALGAAADAGASVAGVYSTPEPRTRMQGEKMYNTDVGLGFDVDNQGELMADPAGMEAARRRRKEGRSFPTWYPER